MLLLPPPPLPPVLLQLPCIVGLSLASRDGV